MPKRTFETLDGLRGLAAVLVVMFHCGPWLKSLTPPKAFLCVDLFFMLSGFVVANAYEPRFQNGMKAKDFILIRLVRLYPLYFLGFLFGITHYILNRSINFGWTARPFYWHVLQMFMLPSPTWREPIKSIYPLNDPSWSLMFEVIINVIYVYTWKFWSKRNIIAVISIVYLLMITNHAFTGDGGHTWDTVYSGVLRTLYAFPLGVLLYRFKDQILSLVPKINSLLVVAALPLLLTVVIHWTWQICLLIGFPLLLVFAIRSQPTAFLRPVIDQIGKASYAIYVIHWPLIYLMTIAISLYKITIDTRVIAVLFIVLIVPFGVLLNYIYDTPVRSFVTRGFLAPKPVSA